MRTDIVLKVGKTQLRASELTSDQVDNLKLQFIQFANLYMSQNVESKSFELPDKKILNNMFLYFIGSDKSEYPLNKGLWLNGNIGTGKTTLMKIFAAYRQRIGLYFGVIEASTIAKKYRDSGEIFSLLKDLCIDDLGRELNPSMHFGNKLNVLQFVLQERYNLWQNNGFITHITTNKTSKQILELYQDYIFDRCAQFCTIIDFSGKSKRTGKLYKSVD